MSGDAGVLGRALRLVTDVPRLLTFRAVDAHLRRMPGAEVVFFENDRFPWIDALEAEWCAIREEVEPLLPELASLPRVRDIEGFGESPVDEWRALFLRFGGERVAANAARCPRTDALLEEVPGVVFALLSVLEGATEIPLHRGYTKSLLRLHLPLVVPARPEDCAITIGGETRSWYEGRAFVFDDTHEHRVTHTGDEPRVVLILDFHRPLTGWRAALSRVGLGGLIGSSYFRRMRERILGASA